jgi:hypothetical protein
MLVLRDPADASLIADPCIRILVALRFEQLGTIEDGQFIVVEPGDTVDGLEKQCGCPILYEPFDGAPYGHPDFTPSFDILEDHVHAYEMLFVTTDAFGVTLFIPKREGIDACLLAMCAQYANPAVAESAAS